MLRQNTAAPGATSAPTAIAAQQLHQRSLISPLPAADPPAADPPATDPLAADPSTAATLPAAAAAAAPLVAAALQAAAAPQQQRLPWRQELLPVAEAPQPAAAWLAEKDPHLQQLS